MNILVTGGAGYIGSHTCVELLNAGHTVTVFDNFCNSNAESLRRVERIAGNSLTVVRGDIRDRAALDGALRRSAATAVIHFAGLKAVGESAQSPLDYYDTNVGGTVQLLRAMQACGVKTLVFSSSATVYGEQSKAPYGEDAPLSPTSVYGRTKLAVEQILNDLYDAGPDWRVAVLRYFNPVGAHESGLIGEDPTGTPNNLMPFIAQVAVGKRECLSIFGKDYATTDGTGLRDYIHVGDLAAGHLAALEVLRPAPMLLTVNLGTGRPYSVLEVIAAFEAASGKKIPYRFVTRRAGDVAECFADPSLAKKTLGWQAKYDIERMCRDAWRWQLNNPNGYG